MLSREPEEHVMVAETCEAAYLKHSYHINEPIADHQNFHPDLRF